LSKRSWKRKAHAHRQVVGLDEALDVVARFARPRRAAEDHQRALRRGEEMMEALHVLAAGVGLRGNIRLGIGGAGLVGQHVLGQRQHHRPAPPGGRDLEGARDVLGNAIGAVDPRRPLGERAEHRGEVDLLESLSVAEVGSDVAHEEDHRRGILERGVHADRGLGRARAARDETQPRAVGELSVGLGHVRRRGLVAADDELQLVLHVVEAIEHREEAFARHGEREVGAVHHQLVDEDVSRGAFAHSWRTM
jgi:hypothetical protein